MTARRFSADLRAAFREMTRPLGVQPALRAVAGGGLTMIANAPNPAGVALLKSGFSDETVGAGGLLLGALLPTSVAAAAFLLF